MNFLNLFDKSYYILFVWTETENDFGSDWWRDCREKGIYGSDAAMLWNGGVASFFIHIYLSYVNYKNACNKSAVMVRYIYVR